MGCALAPPVDAYNSRHLHFAVVLGVHGLEERRTDEPTSVLGQVGRIVWPCSWHDTKMWPLLSIRCRNVEDHRHWRQLRWRQGFCLE